MTSKPYQCSKCPCEFNTRLEFDMHKVYCDGLLIVREDRSDAAMLSTCRIERDQQYKRAEEYGRQIDIIWACLVFSGLVNIALIFKIWG